MNIEELVRTIGETIGSTATVKNVYGEPVICGQRVVLPVATVRYSFGGGGGGGHQEGETPRRSGGGGGGGGRVMARPVGLVEVTPEGARFLYYQPPLVVAAAVTAGCLLGLAIGWACRSRD